MILRVKAVLKFKIVFWDLLPCKIIVDNYFTRQYIPEENSRRRENLKSHLKAVYFIKQH
jgi:hypothetical protein